MERGKHKDDEQQKEAETRDSLTCKVGEISPPIQNQVDTTGTTQKLLSEQDPDKYGINAMEDPPAMLDRMLENSRDEAQMKWTSFWIKS